MKPGELQRNISLLWFLHRHVTLKVHKQNFKMASRVSSIRSVVESTNYAAREPLRKREGLHTALKSAVMNGS